MQNPHRPGNRLGFALYRVGREIARSYQLALSPLGVRPDHAGILTAIAYEGPLHIRALSRLLGINRQSIVNAVDELEREGAVERQPHPVDTRVVMVAITRAGKAKLRRIEEIATDYDARLDSIGTPAQRRATLEYLHNLAQSGILGDAFNLLPE
jgi:DNA-binding MarR family transcriptional regulator